MTRFVLGLIVALCMAGTASATTDFTFAAATDGTYSCGTCCVGFTSSDPSHTVDYADATVADLHGLMRLTLRVDGKYYRGTGYATYDSVLGLSVLRGLTLYDHEFNSVTQT